MYDVVQLPIECYAYLRGNWQRVIGVTPNASSVVIEIDGKMEFLPAEQTKNLDLLWPKGIIPDGYI